MSSLSSRVHAWACIHAHPRAHTGYLTSTFVGDPLAKWVAELMVGSPLWEETGLVVRQEVPVSHFFSRGPQRTFAWSPAFMGESGGPIGHALFPCSTSIVGCQLWWKAGLLSSNWPCWVSPCFKSRCYWGQWSGVTEWGKLKALEDQPWRGSSVKTFYVPHAQPPR